MRERIAHIAVAAGAVLAAGTAGAMTSGKEPSSIECRVTAGSKLSEDLSRALCSEVERAIAQAAPGSRFNVEVTAKSPSRLTAQLVMNGKPLPAQNFAIMDGQLDLDSIKQFAAGLASVAKATTR